MVVSVMPADPPDVRKSASWPSLAKIPAQKPFRQILQNQAVTL